jgi:hypothetical protein
VIPEWPASFGPPEYDEMRPLILDHADKMLNQSRRIKLDSLQGTVKVKVTLRFREKELSSYQTLSQVCVYSVESLASERTSG